MIADYSAQIAVKKSWELVTEQEVAQGMDPALHINK